MVVRLFLATLFVFTSNSVLAREFKGVTIPDTIKVDGAELKLNGLGLRKAMSIINVYIGALYVAQPSKDPEVIVNSTTTKRVVLHFLMGVEKDKMQAAWRDGFGKNATSGYSYRSDLNKLNTMMANMKKGETLTFTFFNDKVEVQVKDRSAEVIEGSDFSKTMLRVFINNPPDNNLKNGMLGLN